MDFITWLESGWMDKTQFFMMLERVVFSQAGWLVVEPTPLKNMLVKMGSSSPNRGEQKKHISNHHIAGLFRELLSLKAKPKPFMTFMAKSSRRLGCPLEEYSTWIIYMRQSHG